MNVDVAIIGAGPVGLMLANLLQRAEISYCLVEQRTGRDYWCKALGVSPRTLEIFDQLGILDEALDRGLFFRALNLVSPDGTVTRHEVLEGKYPYGSLSLSQFETENLLEQDLRRHGGSISRGLSFETLSQDDSGVRVLVRDAQDQTQEIQARYLVGCDGAHSPVRKELGLSFEGDRYAPKFMLGDIDLDWDRPHPEVWKFATAAGEMCVVVPIAGSAQRYRVSMATPADMWEKETPDPPSLELLRQKLPSQLKISNLRWSSFYGVSHRLVSDYRQGRVFLAGDAAHIHPPIGGLGMNTGLQDAHNLAWKLAQVIQSQAHERLLESYHPERHKIGAEVVALTSQRMDQKPRDPGAEERANSQLFLDYQDLPWCRGSVPAGHKGAEPGQRVDPIEGLSRPFVRRDLRLLDLLRHSGWTLFGYGGAEVLPQLGSHCRNYLISSQAPSHEETPWIRDPGWATLQTWGTTPGLVLVRPDGYVGWRGTPQEQSDLLSYWSWIQDGQG